MSNNAFDIIRIAEPQSFVEDNIVEVNYDIIVREKSSGCSNSFSEKHRMRHFSIPEVDLVAERCGFRRVLSEEFLTSLPPSQNTWSVCCCFKKL